MDKFQIGYLAGIIDGEGCVYVNKRKPHGRRKTFGYGVKVVVSITSYSLVEWFVTNARLTSIHHRLPEGNRKPQWMCTWNNSNAEWILNTVLPHLVIKKEQAKIGLELLVHMRTTPVVRGQCISPEIISYRDSMKDKISLLNRRGKQTD
jgi:hypothetical protein